MAEIGAGVQGEVEIQGNMEGFGARVYLRCGDTESTTVSQPDGTFIFRQADEGTCEVEVKAPAHLSAKMNGVIVQKGEITYPPPVSLQIGDLNGDGEVNAKDLVLVAAVFGESGSEWHGSPTVGGLVTEMVSPEEFGPDFLTIDFDDPWQFQLTPQGATFVEDTTVTPGFVNQAQVGAQRISSPPNAMMANPDFPHTSNNIPLTVLFESGREKVGMFVGAASELTVKLTAFDEESRTIGSVKVPTTADGLTFIGLSSPNVPIFKVSLDYGDTPEPEVIDDFMFE